MCSSSTLEEIEQQAQDKLRISLSQRFISPIELLTRYEAFHTNAATLLKPETLEYDIHVKRSKEFGEALEKVLA